MTICLIQTKARVAKFPASVKLQTAGSLWTNSVYITADSPILSNNIYILKFFGEKVYSRLWELIVIGILSHTGSFL